MWSVIVVHREPCRRGVASETLGALGGGRPLVRAPEYLGMMIRRRPKRVKIRAPLPVRGCMIAPPPLSWGRHRRSSPPVDPMDLLRSSLRNRLIGAFLVPTLLIVSLYGVLAYGMARVELEQELGRRLTSIGQALAADFSRGLEASQLTRLEGTKERTIARLRARLEGVREDTRARRLFIFDRQMNSLVDTDESVAFGQKLFVLEADRYEIRRALDRGEATTSVLFEDADGTRYKTAYVPIELPEDGEQGGGRVVAALGVEASASYFELLTNVASGLTGLGLLGVLLVVVVGVLVARGLTRPLNRLVVAARRLGAGELGEPVLADDDLERARGGDELDSLAASFEEMRRAILGRDRQMQMMLSGIAHEVRNPLGGMELFCGLLREDLEAMADPDADKIDKVVRLERELDYLNRVVNDFLDFARRKPLERERFEASELGDELTHLLCGQLAETGCQLTVELEPEGVELTADRDRLRRALINVIRNAWQASPGGGDVTLRIREPAERQRVLEVLDCGEGIPADKIDEILTPFFTTREKGSGLGLALTRQILEQHGGALELESTLGEGTTVRFVLPFDPELEPAAPAMEVPEGWLG